VPNAPERSRPLTDSPAELLALGLGNRYTIERELGKGGMSVVYLARDLRHDRPVALKVLQGRLLSSREHAERFLREIRFAAQLTHPHILPLYDSGEIPAPAGAPVLYYVMPFVAGGSLRERLKAEGRIAVDQAIRLIRAVGAALDYAHRRHIAHRDVKPENILLQEGEPVVADFGVARGLCDECDVGPGVTEPGVAVGTPAYMSPEQASGDPVVDARSDQYALACVLYELLTGEPPFAGTGARATMARQATEKPRSPRLDRPEVPMAVERALLRALAKEPSERFASVADFCGALMTPLSGLPEPGAGEARCIAVLPFANASPDPDNEYVSDGITEELINALAQVHGLRVSSKTSVFALKGRQDDVRAIGALLDVPTVLEGSVRRVGDRFRVTAQLTDTATGQLLWSERFDREDRDILALEEDLARSIVATLRTQLLGPQLLAEPVVRQTTRNQRAYHLYLRGRHAWNKRTGPGMEDAVRFFEQAIAEDPGFALAYTGLADAYAQHVDYRAMPVAEGLGRARTWAEKAIALDDSLAEAHTSLGWVNFIYDWDWVGAEREFRRAIELDPGYASARQWYSWFLAAMGRLREALAEAERSVELDPASVSIQRSAGWLHYYARTPALGLARVRRALVMNPESPDNHMMLAVLLVECGQYEEARSALETALDLAPLDSYGLLLQARINLRTGRPAEAHQTWDRFQEISKERYVSPTDFTRLALSLERYEDAWHWLERARAERRGWLVYLRVEPMLDPLRDDPRFLELKRQMGL
jgi:eukaryotic-like serine/threonine-protein kinase